MAPKDGAKVGGGGYLDFAELTEDGPIVCIFHLREFHDPEPGDYGLKVPVDADVLICDGDRAGEVVLGENFFGAPTGPLRGVKNPKKGDKIRDVADPVNGIGDELTFTVKYVERQGTQSFVALDPPSRADSKMANELYAELAEKFPGETDGDLDWDAAAGGAGSDDADDQGDDPDEDAEKSSRRGPGARATAGSRAGRKPWGDKG